MPKTFKQIKETIATVYMSNIDKDDMQIQGEEWENVTRSLDSTHTELMNVHSYAFLTNSETVLTKPLQALYPAVSGKIESVSLEGAALKYESDKSLLSAKVGKPTKFSLDHKENIIFSPIPDSTYSVHIKYIDSRLALDPEGNPSCDLNDNHTLNMPERLQPLYIEWLIYQTLADYMRNSSKPRWQPTQLIADRKKTIFMAQLKPCNEIVRYRIQ